MNSWESDKCVVPLIASNVEGGKAFTEYHSEKGNIVYTQG